jgi:hypothetical protein
MICAREISRRHLKSDLVKAVGDPWVSVTQQLIALHHDLALVCVRSHADAHAQQRGCEGSQARTVAQRWLHRVSPLLSSGQVGER